ncbi:MAG: flippase-like domain-containing protein [Prevotella sp.]|nr:flippase-like domain-containing protein [Prevotella sp.]
MKHTVNNLLKIALPLVLGGGILYWMYRGFDFRRIEHVLLHEMDWTWMLLSFPFGIMAQVFRGWRWRQTLQPTGESPRTSTSVNAVFLSYAASLVVPRIGEFTRCGVLSRYDGVSFSKALGTVVTERAIDTVVVLLVTGLTLLFQMSVFGTFFDRTGTSIDSLFTQFSATGYLVTALCGVAVLLLAAWLLRRLSLYNKVKDTLRDIWQGIVSLKNVKNIPLFLFFTIGIWVCYFLHYYLTFFCFPFTENLGIACALVTFVVGSIAVIVPTPNGAGPWHFAVKTMLILYGVADEQALYFVLIVHTVQTMLVIALGIYAWMALNFTSKVRGKSLQERLNKQQQS